MSGGGRGASDPRFAKVFSDPRFRTVKKKDLKVKLDDRFNKQDLKKEFTLLKSTTKVDKYGRKTNGEDDVIDNLDKYYEDQDDEDKEIASEKSGDEDDEEDQDEEENEDNESSEDEEESEMSETELDPLAKARGLVDVVSSEEELDSSDEEVANDYDDDSDEDKEVIPEQDPSNRIAVVNLDWDHLKSVDLFATFNSFLPQDGVIANVTIYKSQYGKERMEDEDINGPPKEIFASSKPKKEISDDESETDEEDLDLAQASKKLFEENSGTDEGFNSTELRKYQLQRLRYYYAIVEFGNVESAMQIYKSCDGTEFESSGNFFDLRYVPEDMEFEESDIRDTCSNLPANYQPIEFATDSLRNSKPKLTWDETPVERVQMLSKSFKQGELDELDLKNYLASDSENDDEDNESNINKYKMLVGNTADRKKSKNRDNEDEDEGDVDMEFTFTPKGAEKSITQADGELSTIDKLRQKEKDRRKSRKQKIKELKKEAEEKKKKVRRNNAQDNKDTNEAPIDTSDLPDLQHFSVKELAKLEKLKSKKNKFKNKRQRELEEQLSSQYAGQNDKLTIDDRFAEMVDDHAFAGGSELLKEERRKRKKQKKD